VAGTRASLDGIVVRAKEIDSLIAEIASSSNEQSTALAEVNAAVNQMDQVTQQNAAMVEQANAAAAGLRDSSSDLSRIVSRFTIGRARRGSRPSAPSTPFPASPNRVGRMQQRIAAAVAGPAPAASDWEEF